MADRVAVVPNDVRPCVRCGQPRGVTGHRDTIGGAYLVNDEPSGHKLRHMTEATVLNRLAGFCAQCGGDPDDKDVAWSTPHGPLHAYVRDRYRGLRGQWRLCLVGDMGRVYHYDEDTVYRLLNSPA